ncbi:MAG: DUF1905 domain-containing protein [Anaerolineae bacterium]
MPQKHEFDALLVKGGDEANSGYFVTVPPEIVAAFGKKGQVKVKAEVDGYTYRTSIAPYGGRHLMVVRKELHGNRQAGHGGDVHVTLEADTEPRVVEVPPDFAGAMRPPSRRIRQAVLQPPEGICRVDRRGKARRNPAAANRKSDGDDRGGRKNPRSRNARATRSDLFLWNAARSNHRDVVELDGIADVVLERAVNPVEQASSRIQRWLDQAHQTCLMEQLPGRVAASVTPSV